MGLYLTTDIITPQVVAAGGVLSGNFTTTSPGAGRYYAVMEQYSSALIAIPGSRAYLYQAVIGGRYVSSTVNYTVVTSVAVGETGLGAVDLTLPNTNCYVYVFLKRIASVVLATALVAGTTYKILSVGTTDFTLVGAAANTPQTLFVATGAGIGTGIVCDTPDPDIDETIDYVVITVQSSVTTAQQLDIGSLMNTMISFMIVAMMMGMMIKMMTGESVRGAAVSTVKDIGKTAKEFGKTAKKVFWD